MQCSYISREAQYDLYIDSDKKQSIVTLTSIIFKIYVVKNTRDELKQNTKKKFINQNQAGSEKECK